MSQLSDTQSEKAVTRNDMLGSHLPECDRNRTPYRRRGPLLARGG